MRKLLLTQLLLVALVAVGSYLQFGQPAAQAALFGGCIALVNTLLLAWRVRNAGHRAEQSSSRGALTLYLGAVERFVFTLLAFIAGMGMLKLPPLPMLVAFAAAQLGYWIAARDSNAAGEP
jgi:ATP synthase protein I